MAEETRQHADVCHAFWSVAARALCAETLLLILIVQVCKLMAVLASLLLVGSLRVAALAFRVLPVLRVPPIRHLLARDAEVGVVLWQLPCLLALFPLLLKLTHLARKDHLKPALLALKLTLPDDK